MPDVLVCGVASMVFALGGAVCLTGLALVGERCVWRIRERLGKYKQLHAYIKAHAKEFVEWNKKYNKAKEQNGL